MQEEFLFEGEEAAPVSFFPEREEAINELERRFGIILNKRVRVTLREIPGEFEGKIVVDELILPKSRNDGLPLRMGSTTFDLQDVESCTLLN